ncbi:MAG TPA: hypothetical protein VEL28_07295 [Candidatus Binatia bacterium]|nr:hypothetical protein [Candidatus Binatia bacterium]
MAYIQTISPRNAGAELVPVVRYMHSVVGVGLVANVVRLFSLRPASMRRMIRTWELAMWVGEEPRARRELVAAMVSRLNQCVY